MTDREMQDTLKAYLINAAESAAEKIGRKVVFDFDWFILPADLEIGNEVLTGGVRNAPAEVIERLKLAASLEELKTKAGGAMH